MKNLITFIVGVLPLGSPAAIPPANKLGAPSAVPPASRHPLIYQSGQALVALLIFVMMGLAIATAASFIIAANSLASTNVSEGIIAREMADTGIETAYLQILRKGTSYNGETLNFNGGTVVVSAVSSGSDITIDSVATNGNFTKKVESVVSYSNNVLTVISWKEI